MMRSLGSNRTRDLDGRNEIRKLVNDFYREVVSDSLLAPMFGETADWAEQIPGLVDYWCQVILRDPGYSDFLPALRRAVHELWTLEVEHFDRWYWLWVRCVDARWSGPLAERAKTHAEGLAAVLARRAINAEWEPHLHTPSRAMNSSRSAD